MDKDFCPWAAAEELGVRVLYHPLKGARGCTNGTDTIWLDPRTTELEQRMTLIHELTHIRYGHTGHQPDHIEHHVRGYVARFILKWEDIMQYAEYQAPHQTIAEELGVTPDILTDRLHHATPDELHQLHRMRVHQWA